MAITLIAHSRGYAFAWHVIGTSWYLPSDKVNDYLVGDLPPNYPVPAPLWLSDTAIGWSLLRCDCAICAENYNDQLWDDVYIATS